MSELAEIKSWDQAVEAFPCRHCRSIGLKAVGHSLSSGSLYGVCKECQPESTRASFRHLRSGAAPYTTANQLIRRRYPVRFFWHYEQSTAVVTDRASGEIVWEGERGAPGLYAKLEAEKRNRAWQATLSDDES